jgi:DNA-binding NarL/FixJ family response regulator
MPGISKGVMPIHSEGTARQRADALVFTEKLTPRETEVLCLMADGFTTKVIAARLGMQFKTAACHRTRILQKLGVNNTVAAVRWAIRQGIVVA